MLLEDKKIIIFCFLVIVLMVFSNLKAYSADDNSKEYPDIFVHENIHIAPEQTIGHLMVASGNAIVAGRVAENIIIADGDLTLENGASVYGNVVVLGGNINIEQGAKLAKPPKVIAPKGHPFVSIIIKGIFILCGASLILVPMLLWLIGHYLKKTSWYAYISKLILVMEQRWPAVYIFISLGLSALMLTAFSFLAWETIFRHATELFDNIFIWLIRYFNNPSIDHTMIFISDLGEGEYFIFLILVAYGLLLYDKRKRELAALTICLSGGAGLVLLLKNIFQRSRPELYRVITETGYSFPSGHALMSLCFYGMIAFLIMRNISAWRGRLTVMTLANILVVLIGISRIYLGVHYPSDVAAGYAAGSMWLAFCISLLMWWERGSFK